MKKIDCFWDLENLNKKTLEIHFSENDLFEEVLQLENNYEYIVCKAKKPGLKINQFQENGYKFIENQLSISKKVTEDILSDKRIKRIVNKFNSEKIDSQNSLNHLLSNINENLFDTDRIFLDNEFPKGQSSIRYKNWIKSEFKNNSEIDFIMYNNKKIGFVMYKLKGNNCHVLLGGIFDKYKGVGLGMSVVLLPIKIALDLDLKKIRTKISSNNFEVLKLYNHMNYKIDNLEAVFVKHKKVKCCKEVIE